MDGAEYWRSFVSSSATCVTSSSGDRLGNLFCSGKSSVMLETRSNSFLGMYDVIHQLCIISGRTYHTSWSCGAPVILLCSLSFTGVLVPGGGAWEFCCSQWYHLIVHTLRAWGSVLKGGVSLMYNPRVLSGGPSFVCGSLGLLSRYLQLSDPWM